jgi:hypothetical protein
VEESRYLRELNLCKGETKILKRTKGIEKQYRLSCTNCDIAIAYRPVPPSVPTKYLYVLKGSVSPTKGGSKRQRSEEQPEKLGAAPLPTGPPPLPTGPPPPAGEQTVTEAPTDKGENIGSAQEREPDEEVPRAS